MSSSFSIAASRFSAIAEPGFLEEIRAHTASDEEANSILRGIERLGGDSSIRRYEMTPTVNQRKYHGAPSVGWSVRAVRL